MSTNVRSSMFLQNIDVEISKLYVYYDRQSELLATFHENCASFPVIINQLQEITDSLGE